MPPSYTQLINDFIVLLKPSARKCRNLLTRHDYNNDSIVSEEYNQYGPRRRFLEANNEISASRKTCNLLKMTNSVTIALITGDDSEIENKSFMWTTDQCDAGSHKLIFDFVKPEYISFSGLADKISISFNNTDVWMKPVSQAVSVVPDGWSITLDLPP